MATIANIVILALEAYAFWSVNIPRHRWRLLRYYTEISNLLAAIASLLLVVFGQSAWVAALRYTSVCMLLLTASCTVCVLVPMGGDPKDLLWSPYGLCHHLLCPAACLVSYVALEQHAGAPAFAIPVLVTVAYGIVLLWLNSRGIVHGPYPFLKVHEQSVLATVLWMVGLALAIAAFSGILVVLAP